MKYLIKKAWYDPLENRNYFGYSDYGYTDSEEAAEAFVKRGGKVPQAWAYFNSEPPPMYVYKKLSHINDC